MWFYLLAKLFCQQVHYQYYLWAFMPWTYFFPSLLNLTFPVCELFATSEPWVNFCRSQHEVKYTFLCFYKLQKKEILLSITQYYWGKYQKVLKKRTYKLKEGSKAKIKKKQNVKCDASDVTILWAVHRRHEKCAAIELLPATISY